MSLRLGKARLHTDNCLEKDVEQVKGRRQV